jgi:hypothetical protein
VKKFEDTESSRQGSMGRPELRAVALLCLALSCGGSVLLLAAAALNSPPLLLSAGGVAAVAIAIGVHSLFPAVAPWLLGAMAGLVRPACFLTTSRR